MINEIQEMFGFTIGEIASLFSLPRSEAAKIVLNRETPVEKMALMHRFHRLAQMLKEHNLGRSDARNILRMRINGKPLLESVLDDSNEWEDMAKRLIFEVKMAHCAYISSGLSRSKAKPTNDWQTEISIPSACEN